MKTRLFAPLFFLALLPLTPCAAPLSGRYFSEVTLAVDTSLYALSRNTVVRQRKHQLYFEYSSRYPVCELRFYPKEGSSIQQLSFAASAGYEVLDSLAYLSDEACYRGRIRLLDLLSNAQLSVLVSITALREEAQVASRLWELALFPYTTTWVKLFHGNDVLFVGEEKTFELTTNNLDNIKLPNDWQVSNGVDYRVTLRDGRLMLIVRPRELGAKAISVALETVSPFLGADSLLCNTVTLSTPTFTVKASRLVFLNMDKQEITYDDESRYRGVSVAIDNNNRLQLQKTYRIEDQEAAGGSLIGELFTVKDLANDKVLCKLTVFNLHRSSDGYLYIKVGDAPTFITNLDITPETKITSIHVLHEGEDWQGSTRVHPGEQVDVRITGESLHKARFAWQDAINLTSDTTVQTETQCFFRLLVPMSVSKPQVALLNNGHPTGKALSVEEYQHPRPFDFVTLGYGHNASTKLNKVSNTIVARSVITDFMLSFDNADIDSKSKLYGKQYLDIDVRLLGKKGEIVELRSLKNQLVCPDETSPRGGFYKDKSCLSEGINLNTILSNKTINMEPMSTVQLDIRQAEGKYSEPVFAKRVEVVYQPKVLFDIDLSLPAGMMIQNLGKSQSEKDAEASYNVEMGNYSKAYGEYVGALNAYTAAVERGEAPSAVPPQPTPPEKPKKASFTDNLGGISIALIAQFRFTDGDKAGKLMPFRCGAGFLFINTLNFSESAKRDLAIVAFGSIYPLGSRRMWNVPIHIGLGYKIQDSIPFVMISPGISVSF